MSHKVFGFMVYPILKSSLMADECSLVSRTSKTITVAIKENPTPIAFKRSRNGRWLEVLDPSQKHARELILDRNRVAEIQIEQAKFDKMLENYQPGILQNSRPIMFWSSGRRVE